MLPLTRQSPWPFRLLTALVASVLSLGALELAYRIVKLKRLTIPAGIEHSHFHHRLKPHTTYHFSSSEFDVHIRTNSYGLRGADPVIPKPAGVLRILMLGDSYTFGFPVKDEETFASLIQEALRELDYPVEVINGGVSGYSPTLHYISLRDQYLAFEPDLVVLWYDLGDLQEDAWFQKNLLYDETGRIVRCDPAYINGRFSKWEWMRNHSMLANYFDRKVIRLVKAIRILGFWEFVKTKLRGERAKVAIARLKASERSADLASSDRFLLVRPYSSAENLASYWTLSSRYLVMIRDLLAERHIPFVLGIYPYGMLVGPDQWADGRVFWGFKKGKTYDSSAALSIFKQFSAKEHISLINTFESFRAAAASERLFYNWDGHMTPAGHRVLATHVVNDPQFLHLVSSLARERDFNTK